jgi:hypothetical protein
MVVECFAAGTGNQCRECMVRSVGALEVEELMTIKSVEACAKQLSRDSMFAVLCNTPLT